MIKKVFAITLVVLFAMQWGYSLSKEEIEDLKGRRKLPLKKRITSEGRYKKLVKRIKVPQDRNDICNQLLYIENGYYDYGYLPEQDKYYKHNDVPSGFWVYVYPYWYIWENQVLFE